MTTEEKAVFQCLEDEELSHDSEGVYEELEDDFLLLANEGKPALIEASTEDGSKALKNNEDFENKDVVFVRDEEAEALKAMREEIKKRFGLG